MFHHFFYMVIVIKAARVPKFGCSAVYYSAYIFLTYLKFLNLKLFNQRSLICAENKVRDMDPTLESIGSFFGGVYTYRGSLTLTTSFWMLFSISSCKKFVGTVQVLSGSVWESPILGNNFWNLKFGPLKNLELSQPKPRSSFFKSFSKYRFEFLDLAAQKSWGDIILAVFFL